MGYGAGPTSSVRGESRILSSSLGRRSPPVLTGVWGNSGEDDISQRQLLMGNRSGGPRCALGVPARPAGFQFSRMASLGLSWLSLASPCLSLASPWGIWGPLGFLKGVPKRGFSATPHPDVTSRCGRYYVARGGLDELTLVQGAKRKCNSCKGRWQTASWLSTSSPPAVQLQRNCHWERSA